VELLLVTAGGVWLSPKPGPQGGMPAARPSWLGGRTDCLLLQKGLLSLIAVRR
jgi:hypothetical protein